MGPVLLDAMTDDELYKSPSPDKLCLQAPMIVVFMEDKSNIDVITDALQSTFLQLGTMAHDQGASRAYVVVGSNNYTVKLWRLRTFTCGHGPSANRYLHLETVRTEAACVRDEPVTDQSKWKVAKLIVVPPARLASLSFDCL